MRYKVAVTDYIFPNLDIEAAILSKVQAEIVAEQCKTEDDVIALAKDADAIMNTYYGPISEYVISNLEKSRIIVRFGIGVDTIDIPAATKYGIMVANIPDYCIEEVSDHAASCILALGRKIVFSDRTMRAGVWGIKHLKPMGSFSGKTLGIIGFGRIGRLVAKKLKPFGFNIVFYDPFMDSNMGTEFNARKLELDELLKRSDFITIHSPATKENHHLLNKARFDMMKDGVYIVNTARGELIDTDALIEALKSQKVAGAALDVIENVPPLENIDEMTGMDNVILTPHSAWYTDEAIIALRTLASEEVVRVLTGDRPKNLLNPEVLNK